MYVGYHINEVPDDVIYHIRCACNTQIQIFAMHLYVFIAYGYRIQRSSIPGASRYHDKSFRDGIISKKIKLLAYHHASLLVMNQD